MKYIQLFIIAVLTFSMIEVVSAYDRAIKLPPSAKAEMMSEKWKTMECENPLIYDKLKAEMCGVLAYQIDIQALQYQLDSNNVMIQELFDRIKTLEKRIEEMKKEALKIDKGVNYGNRKQQSNK